jgi:hypothetical protein
LAQDVEQVIVVFAHNLDEQVERAGDDDDIVDLLHTRQRDLQKFKPHHPRDDG